METSVVVEGLSFPESPRWHDGRLFIVDMGTGAVLATDPEGGDLTIEVPRVPGRPSGLAWDDAGRLLIVSMGRSSVYRDDGGERLTLLADASGYPGGWRNDAVRHRDGWLYIGATGRPADLVCVCRDGSIRSVAAGLGAPNGMVITPDGSTLIVAEFAAHRLIAFDIQAGGRLSLLRVWADLPAGCTPDGICLDDEGAVWLAWADTPRLFRVAEGGEILDSVRTGQPAFACMLGGPDRQTLYACTAPGSNHASRQLSQGRIECLRVDVAGAGWP